MGLGIIRSAEEFIWNNHGAILQEMMKKFYHNYTNDLLDFQGFVFREKNSVDKFSDKINIK